MNAIIELLGPDAVNRLGWVLVHFLWQGAAVAAALLVILKFGVRWSAQARYVAAYLALLVAAAMPAATWVWLTPSHARATARDADVVATGKAAVTLPPPVVTEADERPRSTDQPPRGRFDDSIPLIVTAWLAGVALLGVYRAGGWVYVQHLRRHGRVPESLSVHRQLDRLRRAMRLRRVVRILHCPRIDSPAVVGVIKPVILLPLACALQLTPAQLEAILAHELAHVRRHDYLLNLIQTAVETLLFFHPAVWWMSRRIRIEREHAADDLALRATRNDRATYAGALAALEELRTSTPPAPALAARGGPLLARVRRVLGAPAHPADRATWWPAAALFILVAFVVIGATNARVAANNAPSTIPSDRTAVIECVDQNGQPVAGADVYLIDWSRLDGKTKVSAPDPVRTGADGVARFHRLPNPTPLRGEMIAYARVPGKLVGLAQQSPDVVGGGPLDRPLRLVLRPSVTLRGRVHVPQRMSLDHAQVRLRSIGNAQVDAGRLTEGGSLWGDRLAAATHLVRDVFDLQIDQNGAFEIHDVPENGGVTIVVEAPGFAREIAVAGFRRMGDFEIDLRPEAMIEGKIEVPLGMLLPPDVSVRAMSDGRPVRIGHEIPFESKPSPDGSYRLERLPEDVYLIRLTGLPDAWVAPIEGIRVGTGEQRRDVNFKAGPGHEVHGTVTDAATGKPLAGVIVVVDSAVGIRSEMVNRSKPTADDGRFTVHAPEGQATIRIFQYPSGYSRNEEKPGDETFELPAGADVNLAELNLKLTEGVRQPRAFRHGNAPWVKIAGRVIDRQGNPVPGVHVGVRMAHERRPDEDGLRAWNVPVTDENGLYEIGAQSAEVELVVFLEEGPTSAANSKPFVVRGGSQPARVDDLVVDRLPVRSDIGGVIVSPSENPVPGASVSLAGLRSTKSDSAGRFRFDLYDEKSPVSVDVQVGSYQRSTWRFIPPGTGDARFVLRPVNPRLPEWSEPPPLPDPTALVGKPAPEFDVTWVVRPDEAAQPPAAKRADGKATALLFVGSSPDADGYRRQIEGFAEACAGHNVEPVVIFSPRFHEAAVRGFFAGTNASMWAGIDRWPEDDTPMTFPGATLMTYGTRDRRGQTIFVIDDDGVVRHESNTPSAMAEFLKGR